MQIHSQAKVEFYKTYLERYVAILCQSRFIKRIRIYDVFCGMGIYEDGGKGSPIVAYETIKGIYNAHKITNETKISLIINDKSETRIAKVKDYIDSNRHSYCDVRPYNLEINRLFEIITPEIDDTPTDTRNFVYSFFPDTNHPIRQSTINVKDYIHYVADALKFQNKFFATSYYIERDKSNFFALFFISSNIFGFEKILETKWVLDEEHGGGFKLPDATGNLFAEEFALENKNENARKLKSILEEFLRIPHTNIEE